MIELFIESKSAQLRQIKTSDHAERMYTNSLKHLCTEYLIKSLHENNLFRSIGTSQSESIQDTAKTSFMQGY